MEKEKKIQAFEFILFILIQLYEKNRRNNDLSILKTMKILFFISTAKVENKEDLLNIFDTYYALPYGPVEMDIYEAVKNNRLYFFHVGDTTLSKNRTSISSKDFNLLDDELKESIIKSIELLIKENPSLLYLKAFDLVEISHKWFSWNYYFNLAKSKNQLKMRIPIDIIKEEPRFYHL